MHHQPSSRADPGGMDTMEGTFLGLLIPEEKITEVKNAADIVDIIADAVVLKKAGKNYLGLCPFHSEKTPSFSVSPDRQIFHCFGCGTGGNVFTFIMKHQGLAFPDAVKSLANRFGIELPSERMSPGQRQEMSQREMLYKLNRMAMGFYSDCLKDSRMGRQATAYLQGRGFDTEAMAHFGLGYAPASWDQLVRFLKGRKVPSRIVEQSGLVVPRNQGGGHYDRFRDRVMFPIFDGAERVIGFGGRVIGDGQPKYMNSPETPVYSKGSSLYGINWARQSCRQLRQVFIVEGYLDLLSLHLGGVQNVVATLGTALTAQQIRALKGIVGSGTITLVFDSDDAGMKAAHRSLELFWQEHTNFGKGDVFSENDADTRILVLPAGHDPDSYIRQFGADAFWAEAEKAPGIIPFLCESAIARFGLSVEGKIRVVTELSAALAGIGDPVARSVYIRMIAERLGIDESAIISRLRQVSAHRGRDGRAKPGNAAALQALKPPVPAPGTARGGNPLERMLVTMMIQFPEILPEVRKRRIVDALDDPTLKAAGSAILAHGRADGIDVAAMINRHAGESVASVLSELAMADEKWDMDGCLRLIQQFEMNRNRSDDALVKRIRKAEADNDHSTLLQLLKEKQQSARDAQTGNRYGKPKA
ncbi:MAG: DNA primase [Pseudomonadota bacterium]